MSYPTKADLERDAMLRAEMQMAAPKPDAWTPGAGERLTGVLRRIDSGYTQYGRKPILILEDADGVEHSVWLLQNVLREEVTRLEPQIGDAVSIVYTGVVTRSGAPSYHGFEVTVVPGAGAVYEWTADGPHRVGGGAVAPDVERDASPGPQPEPPAEQVHTPRVQPSSTLESCELCGRRLPFHEPGCSADGIPY